MSDNDGHNVVVGSLGALSDTSGESQQSKLAVFMKRRGSVGADGKPNGHVVPIKASLSEVKQQLRLGPANRAANPLNNSRTGVFKIKQGLTPAASKDTEPNRTEQSMTNDLLGLETTPLLIGGSKGHGHGHGNGNLYGANGRNGNAKSKENGRQ